MDSSEQPVKDNGSSGFSIKNSLLLLLILLILNFIVLQILVFSGILIKGSPIAMGLALTVLYLVIAAAVYGFAKATSKDPLKELGFRKVNILNALYSLILGLFAIISASYFYSLAIKLLGIKAPDMEQTIVQMFGKSLPALAVMFFVVVIIAPFAEELLFRGYIYPSFKNRLGIVWGLIISSAMFALLHVTAIIFFPVYFFIGLVLGYAREKDGSVFTPMVLHALNNGLFFAILVFNNLKK